MRAKGHGSVGSCGAGELGGGRAGSSLDAAWEWRASPPACLAANKANTSTNLYSQTCRARAGAALVQADKYGVPRICFVNKMDRMGANFLRTRDMVRAARPSQVPAGRPAQQGPALRRADRELGQRAGPG